MRKTLLITQFFPPAIGGMQSYYFNLCQHLPMDKIVVLTHQEKKTDKKQGYLKADFKIIRRNFFNKLFWPHWLPLVGYVNQLIKKKQIECLWAGEVLPTGSVVWLLSRLYSLPYIVSSHGTDLLHLRQNRRKNKLARFIFQGAAKLTANSEFTRLLLVKAGLKREKILVVYPCPALPTVSNHSDSSLARLSRIINLKKQGFKVILTVARLVPNKGIDSVLQALNIVWQKFDKIIYLIVGQGPDKERLKHLAGQQRLSSQIIFLNSVQEEEKVRLYEICDIFIMTPRRQEAKVEGFGLVYLEASSAAKPVIGSKLGGIPEAVVDYYDDNLVTATGLLVDNPLNHKEIAKKIIILLSNPKLASRLGANGYTYSRRFSWQREAEKLRQLFGGI